MDPTPQDPSPPRPAVAGNAILAAVALGAVVGLILVVASSRRGSARTDASAESKSSSAANALPSSSVPRAEEDAPTATGPKWVRTKQPQWGTDGSRSMGFELAAEREVHVYMDRVRPILAARCISRQLQIFVVLRSAASIERNDDTHTVQIGFDDDAPVDQHWLESSDKQGLFSPDGQAFAAQLASAHRLRFGFKPFNAPAASAEFDVRGFEGPLDAMTRTCGLASSSARGVRARAPRP